jgi:uncharacterized membrane protein YfcA
VIELHANVIALLLVAALFAGWIDAVAGGGGLIQLPALLLVFPHSATLTAMGTNKTSSIIGTSVAVRTYTRAHTPDWGLARRIMAVAFVASGLGSFTATRVSTEFLRPVIVVVLACVWLFTVVRRPVVDHEIFQTAHGAKALVIAGVVGFYDGLIGPGTGSFLLIGFVTVVGLTFLGASVAAKLANWATNLASILVFGATGHILVWLALAMGAANALGGWLGARTAIAKGSSFVRLVFLCSTGALLVKLAWSLV